MNEFWETRDPKTMMSVWHCKVGIPELNLVGVGSDYRKDTAKFFAA